MALAQRGLGEDFLGEGVGSCQRTRGDGWEGEVWFVRIEYVYNNYVVI